MSESHHCIDSRGIYVETIVLKMSTKLDVSELLLFFPFITSTLTCGPGVWTELSQNSNKNWSFDICLKNKLNHQISVWPEISFWGWPHEDSISYNRHVFSSHKYFDATLHVDKELKAIVISDIFYDTSRIYWYIVVNSIKFMAIKVYFHVC